MWGSRNEKSWGTGIESDLPIRFILAALRFTPPPRLVNLNCVA